LGERAPEGLKYPLLEQYDVGDIKLLNQDITKLKEKQISEDFLNSLPDYSIVFK
jgi:hypothetical protein